MTKCLPTVCEALALSSFSRTTKGGGGDTQTAPQLKEIQIWLNEQFLTNIRFSGVIYINIIS